MCDTSKNRQYQDPAFKSLSKSQQKVFYDPAGLFSPGGDPIAEKTGIADAVDKGLGRDKKTPAVVEQDPAGDARRAADAAAQSANTANANTRSRRRASSLLASGGARGVEGGSALGSAATAYGKSKLGS
jgi:hypothetical protein